VLFALPDGAAAIVDAPAIMEDNQGRVLAYSSGKTSPNRYQAPASLTL